MVHVIINGLSTDHEAVELHPLRLLSHYQGQDDCPDEVGFISLYFWWLVRVTLVVDWLFLPQNFGPVVGTYEDLLQLCDTQPLYDVIELFSITGGGDPKT